MANRNNLKDTVVRAADLLADLIDAFKSGSKLDRRSRGPGGTYVALLTDAEKRLRKTAAAFPELLAACEAALVRMDRLDDAGSGEHSPFYLQVEAVVKKYGDEGGRGVPTVTD